MVSSTQEIGPVQLLSLLSVLSGGGSREDDGCKVENRANRGEEWAPGEMRERKQGEVAESDKSRDNLDRETKSPSRNVRQD